MKTLVLLISFILIGQLAQSQFIIKDSTIVGFDKFILGTHKSVFERQLKPVVYTNDAKPGEKMYQYFFLKNERDSILGIKINALCLFFDKYDSLIRVTLDFYYRDYKRPHYKKEAKIDFEKVKSSIFNLLSKEGELKLIPKRSDFKQYNWTNNSVFVFTNLQRGVRTPSPSLDSYTILLQISYRN